MEPRAHVDPSAGVERVRSEASPVGMGNLTFSLGMGKDAGASWQRLSEARPQLGMREPGFCEDSLASGTWDCQKGKAQRLEREKLQVYRQGKSLLDHLSNSPQSQIQTELALSFSCDFQQNEKVKLRADCRNPERPPRPSAGPTETPLLAGPI